MPQNNPIKSIVFFSRTGCLLPLLIILNLLLGWIFLRPIHWLMVEAILLLFFIINSYIIMRKIRSAFPKRDDIIDVEAQVLEQKDQDTIDHID